VTPAEHDATVRFKDAVRAVRPRYRELNSPLWDVLDEAVALAERATELERDLGKAKEAAQGYCGDAITNYLRAKRSEAVLDHVIDQAVVTWHDESGADWPDIHPWIGLTPEQFSAWVEGGAKKLVALEETAPEVAYGENLSAQEAVYWEARRQGMNLTDKQVGDLLRVAARAGFGGEAP